MWLGVAHNRGFLTLVSGCLAVSAPTPPSLVRLLSLSDSFIAWRWCGPVCWSPLRPILALAGCLARHSTAPTLQFLYSGQARSRNLSTTGVVSQGGRCLRRGEPGFLCIPAHTCRHWSAAHLAGRPPRAAYDSPVRRSMGESHQFMAEAGMARQCPARAGTRRSRVLLAPIPPGDSSGCPAAWAGASAGPDASAAPRAAGDGIRAASSAKPFRPTGNRS
jgi:hypothetical protein